MNKLTAARLYMCFALLMFLVGWKICLGLENRVEGLLAQEEIQFDRALSLEQN